MSLDQTHKFHSNRRQFPVDTYYALRYLVPEMSEILTSNIEYKIAEDLGNPDLLGCYKYSVATVASRQHFYSTHDLYTRGGYV